MKPFRAIFDYPVDTSFIVKYDDFPHFNVPLHFHSEYEIVYIIKSFGTKYVGDKIESFGPGDFSFYSNNLDHFYLSDEKSYLNDPDYNVNAIVVLFPSDFFSNKQLLQPEFTHIKKLLNNSARGLKFHENTITNAADMLYKMLKTTCMERYLLLLTLLDYLGSAESQPIASQGYTSSIESFNDHRMEKIYKFCRHNFTRKLTLKEVSTIAIMNPTAFCRYFKLNTEKTFVRYINELRVIFSCEMLKKSDLKITNICSKSGFNNLSNFN